MPTRPPTHLQRLRAAGLAPKVRQDNGNRPSAHAQGYDWRWRKLRKLVLSEQPICAHHGCTAPATEVDHIEAKTKGGSDERSNLIGYCKPHHSAKTYRVDGSLRGRAAVKE